MEIPRQELLISEDKYINPLTTVLQEVTPQDYEHAPKRIKPQKSLRKSLDELFPEQKHEDRSIQEAKRILGRRADKFTQEQLKDTITEIKYLVSTWLDDFERELFEGQTLKELLHEKEGV